MRVAMRYGKKGLVSICPTTSRRPSFTRSICRSPPTERGPCVMALGQPRGCRPLSEEAKGCKSVCICICDVTRPVPNGLVLPVLVDELIEAGWSPEAITVLVATGLHRPNEGQELREIVGSDRVLETVRVVNHFARNDADHVLLGTTSVRHAGQARQALRGRRPAHRRRPCGAPFHGGLFRGQEGIIPGVAHEETIRCSTRRACSTRIWSHNTVLDG